MIQIKVNGEKYIISENLSVTDGKHKEIITYVIEIIRSNYNVSDGFFEPYLYIKLSNVKWIELISFKWSPHDKRNVNY